MTLAELLPATIPSFALASLLIELTPGPNMAYLAMVSARLGRLAGFVTVAGVAVGLAILAVVAVGGVAAVVATTPLAYNLLRWFGVAYLVYLAWDCWREGDSHESAPHSSSRHFVRGLLTNHLNPKAAIFYLTVLPAFTERGPNEASQTLVLSVVYVGIATVVHSGIVVLAGFAETLLSKDTFRRYGARLFSIGLLLVAVWVGWTSALGAQAAARSVL
jgi:threonine/homoserine/homoserine lactone efflux protein